MSAASQFTTPQGNAMRGPNFDSIQDAISILRGRVCIQTRAREYLGGDILKDRNHNNISDSVSVFLRLSSRFLLCENPIAISTVKELGEALHKVIEEIELEPKRFFVWYFNCKLGGKTVLYALYRSFATASDNGSKRLAEALKNPSINNFSRFVGTDPESARRDPEARAIFDMARDKFFSAMGIDRENFANSDLGLPKLTASMGLFRHFFNTIKELYRTQFR